MDFTTAIQVLNRAAAYLDDLWGRATEEEAAKFPLGAQEIDCMWEMARCLARDMGPLDNILADDYSARLLLHATEICIDCLGCNQFRDFATALRERQIVVFPTHFYIAASTRLNSESKACL